MRRRRSVLVPLTLLLVLSGCLAWLVPPNPARAGRDADIHSTELGLDLTVDCVLAPETVESDSIVPFRWAGSKA